MKSWYESKTIWLGTNPRRFVPKQNPPPNPEGGSLRGSPNGSRTRVSALRGQRPRPLDDGAGKKHRRRYRRRPVVPMRLVARGGFEPP